MNWWEKKGIFKGREGEGEREKKGSAALPAPVHLKKEIAFPFKGELLQ